MNEPPITMSEANQAGYCARGQRRFLRERVPDWRDYVKNGLPIELAREINPAMTEHILKLREARRGKET